MKEYSEAAKEGEIALNNGDYYQCIEIINPLIEKFSVSSKEGINLRMLLVTAYSGINKKDEALKICKQLSKSRSSLIRENAKSLIEILNAPDLKTPENWNIKFENDINNKNNINASKLISKKVNNEKKFIKISTNPTGETKPFQDGFVITTLIMFILLISLLSGCVRIENNLDIRDVNSINMDLSVESKYLGKIPWQINFEKEINDNFNQSFINYDNEKFLIEERGLSLDETKNKLNKIIRIASETTPIKFNDINIDHSEKDYFLVKKHFFSIIFNLTEIDKIDNLELSINIINPSKPIIVESNKNIKVNKSNINWELTAGDSNQIKFIYWDWNKLFVSLIITFLLVFIAYFIKISRYQLGSDLPRLPT